MKNDDGTATFTFRPARERSDRQLLQVPAGRFDVVARYTYLPHEEIVSAAWRFPKQSAAEWLGSGEPAPHSFEAAGRRYAACFA